MGAQLAAATTAQAMAFLKSPTLLARRMSEILAAQEFVGYSLLTGRYTVEGGAIAVPKNEVIPTLDDLQPSQAHLIGKLALAAAEYARKEGFAQNGYRIVMNCREDAGQTVFHIHLHLLAGAPLGHFGAA